MKNFQIILLFSLSMQLVLTQIIQISNQNNDEESETSLKQNDNDLVKEEMVHLDPKVTTMKPKVEQNVVAKEQNSNKGNKKTEQNKKNKEDQYDDNKKAKLTRMENFLHNYMNKLERLLRPLKKKHISDRYKVLAEEYFKRLSSDSIDTPKGFQMGDMTIELLDLSNYVLDTVDISEMKKAGVLKNFLLDHASKNIKNEKISTTLDQHDVSDNSDENDSWFD